jgi:hypothetical protein
MTVNRPLSTVCFFLTGLFLFLSGCASLEPVPFYGPEGQEILRQVLALMEAQEKRVHTFYGSALLEARKWYGMSEANMVMVGTRNPFRLKLEVTHAWGKPVAHILVDKGRVEILSFQERKLYMGTSATNVLSRFFPGKLSEDLVWSVLRGYPSLRPYRAAPTREEGRFVLMDGQSRVTGNFSIDAEDLGPSTVHFLDEGLTLAFAQYQTVDGIDYADEVRMEAKAGGTLILKDKKMVFNRSVPSDVFSIHKPVGFEKVNITEEGE